VSPDATPPVIERPDPLADLAAAYRLIADHPAYRRQPHYVRMHVEQAEGEIGQALAAEHQDWVRGHLRRAHEQLHRQLREKVDQLPPMTALCVHGAEMASEPGGELDSLRFTVRVRSHLVMDGMPCPVPDGGLMTRYRRE